MHQYRRHKIQVCTGPPIVAVIYSDTYPDAKSAEISGNMQTVDRDRRGKPLASRAHALVMAQETIDDRITTIGRLLGEKIVSELCPKR